jgi:octaprenyl-diphosphate synthase
MKEVLKERILTAVQQDLARIETALLENLQPYLPFVSHVAEYIMFGGGKRVRPLLTVLSARLCGYQGNYATTLSVVFEYLHAATLLHDDVVDGAQVRRGNPVAHSIWGSPGTVLVGDFLLARSIAIAARSDQMAIIDLLARTTAEMSEGEIHQLLYKGDLGLDEGQYMEVIRRKTACLMQAACQSGALLAEAPDDQVEALAQYGYRLGAAFQIMDDILDYTADPGVLGKAVGTDLKEGKMTLPLIHALHRAGREDRRKLEAIVHGEHVGDKDFDEVLGLVNKYGGITYARTRAQQEIDAAKGFLGIFEVSETRALLGNLADYVVAREL